MANLFEYTPIQWLLFFFIYCFLGWCVESAIVSYRQRRLVNRGYLTLPMLPIYGTGAIVVLFVSLPVRAHVILVYFFGMIAATILEYITGWVMETTLKVKYWDYSDKFGNVKGRICLESSLFWGVLSIFMTYVIHKPIETFVLSLPVVILNGSVSVISALFMVDFIISTKKAIDFRNMLEYMARTKDKLEELYVELGEKGNVLKGAYAEIGEKGRQFKDAIEGKIEERTPLKEVIGDKLQETISLKELLGEKLEEAVSLKEMLGEKLEEPISLKELLKQKSQGSISLKELLGGKIEESAMYQKLKKDDETAETMSKIELLNKEREEAMEKMARFASILKANPTATSKYFQRALKEAKDRIKMRKM